MHSVRKKFGTLMRGKKHIKEEKDTEDLSNSQQNEDLLQPMTHPVLSNNSFNRSPG